MSRKKTRKSKERGTPIVLPGSFAGTKSAQDAATTTDKQIQELIDLLKRNQLTELEIERGGIRIRVRHEIGVKTVSATMTEQGRPLRRPSQQQPLSVSAADRGRHRSDHDYVANRRHVLSFPFARCRPLCRRRGLREKRAGLVYRGSNEADERD